MYSAPQIFEVGTLADLTQSDQINKIGNQSDVLTGLTLTPGQPPVSTGSLMTVRGF